MDLRSRRRLGVALWVVGFIIAVVLAVRSEGRVEGRGVGFAPAVQLSAAAPTQVQHLAVSIHTPVRQGDVLGQLDTRPIAEEREIVAARLLAAQEAARLSAADDARRLAEGYNRVLFEKVALQIALHTDLAAEDALVERLGVEEQMIGAGGTSAQAVAEWHRQLRVVRARIRETRSGLAALRSATQLAEARAEEQHIPEVWWSVATISRELDAVDGRLQRAKLTAPIDGQVAWIYHQPGEVVVPGEPVLELRPHAATEVIAFLPTVSAVRVQPDQPATVLRATGERIPGRAISVGNGPRPLPEHLWYNPAHPEHGVPVRIAIDGQVGPDEAVTVWM